VRVVGGRAELTARRQQHHDRHPERERGSAGGDRTRPKRPPRAAQRERHEQPEGQRAADHEHDEDAQVRGDRVGRVALDPRQQQRRVGALARDAHRCVAVDALHIHAQAHRQAHAAEAHTPIHERHVEIERAMVAGVGEDPHRSDGEGALEPQRGERGHARAARREAHQRDGQPPAPHSAPATPKAPG
jgi:hypothetical protein